MRARRSRWLSPRVLMVVGAGLMAAFTWLGARGAGGDRGASTGCSAPPAAR